MNVMVPLGLSTTVPCTGVETLVTVSVGMPMSLPTRLLDPVSGLKVRAVFTSVSSVSALAITATALKVSTRVADW